MGRKNKEPMPDIRPLYAIALIALVVLLFQLAKPMPGHIRLRRLQPVAPVPEQAVGETPQRIRLASYNIEHFSDAIDDGEHRTAERLLAQARGAAEIIGEASPDILLLQEIENARALLFLNEQLAHPYPYAYITRLKHASGEKDKLNLAVLSRIPPRYVEEISFQKMTKPHRSTRGSLMAKFNLGYDFTLMAYNIHLKSNYGEADVNRAQRSIALHQLAAHAAGETLANLPRKTGVVIAGDTNVDPERLQFADDPSLDALTGSYVDLWLGRPLEERITIPTREAGDEFLVFEGAAFDRVFVSKNMTADAQWTVGPAQVIQKGTATHNNTLSPGDDGHVSDHYLVYVDIIRTARPRDFQE